MYLASLLTILYRLACHFTIIYRLAYHFTFYNGKPHASDRAADPLKTASWTVSCGTLLQHEKHAENMFNSLSRLDRLS
jgi:hypothetical protein